MSHDIQHYMRPGTLQLPALGKTFAELPDEVKHAHSHRGQSSRAMIELMRERWLAT